MTVLPGAFKLVGQERFELSASATRKQRSTRLSHCPTRIAISAKEGMGFNPKSAWPPLTPLGLDFQGFLLIMR